MRPSNHVHTSCSTCSGRLMPEPRHPPLLLHTSELKRAGSVTHAKYFPGPAIVPVKTCSPWSTVPLRLTSAGQVMLEQRFSPHYSEPSLASHADVSHGQHRGTAATKPSHLSFPRPTRVGHNPPDALASDVLQVRQPAAAIWQHGVVPTVYEACLRG